MISCIYVLRNTWAKCESYFLEGQATLMLSKKKTVAYIRNNYLYDLTIFSNFHGPNLCLHSNDTVITEVIEKNIHTSWQLQDFPCLLPFSLFYNGKQKVLSVVRFIQFSKVLLRYYYISSIFCIGVLVHCILFLEYTFLYQITGRIRQMLL